MLRHATKSKPVSKRECATHTGLSSQQTATEFVRTDNHGIASVKENAPAAKLHDHLIGAIGKPSSTFLANRSPKAMKKIEIESKIVWRSEAIRFDKIRIEIK
jgi:hypothetical protein